MPKVQYSSFNIDVVENLDNGNSCLVQRVVSQEESMMVALSVFWPGILSFLAFVLFVSQQRLLFWWLSWCGHSLYSTVRVQIKNPTQCLSW